jgi:hypothetical protein
VRQERWVCLSSGRTYRPQLTASHRHQESVMEWKGSPNGDGWWAKVQPFAFFFYVDSSDLITLRKGISARMLDNNPWTAAASNWCQKVAVQSAALRPCSFSQWLTGHIASLIQGLQRLTGYGIQPEGLGYIRQVHGQFYRSRQSKEWRPNSTTSEGPHRPVHSLSTADACTCQSTVRPPPLSSTTHSPANPGRLGPGYIRDSLHPILFLSG